MAVQKKSLVGDRTAVKKAIIASKSDTAGQPKPLKAETLTLRAPKMRAATHTGLKMKRFKGV